MTRWLFIKLAQSKQTIRYTGSYRHRGTAYKLGHIHNIMTEVKWLMCTTAESGQEEHNTSPELCLNNARALGFFVTGGRISLLNMCQRILNTWENKPGGFLVFPTRVKITHYIIQICTDKASHTAAITLQCFQRKILFCK